jgi:hypothetical protein
MESGFLDSSGKGVVSIGRLVWAITIDSRSYKSSWLEAGLAKTESDVNSDSMSECGDPVKEFFWDFVYSRRKEISLKTKIR